MHKDYYVYEWYIEDTNHVFYVGKGRLYRINEIRNRNKYFLAIYNKYKCKARKIHTGLTNKEACQLEKETIKKRKLSGEAEGGYLVYKKSCTNKTLYEGKLLTRLK